MVSYVPNDPDNVKFQKYVMTAGNGMEINMKNIRKLVWNDGAVIDLPTDDIVTVTDPDKLWRGGNRVEIIERERQEILGFGGAFTEASGYNYSLLSPDDKKRALELLFGKTGLNYNFCRVCMGSCDFSLDDYSYVPEGDLDTSHFSIERDRKYVIPFIKDAIAYRGGDIFLFASPWTPPAYMKTSERFYGGGKLKPEFYELWAEYFCRFVEEYANEGIRISAVTPQNEPGTHKWESCAYTCEELTTFTECLSNAFAAHGLDVRILGWDFNRGSMFMNVSQMYDRLGDKLWGAGFHWYNGIHTGELDATHDFYPDHVLVETEFCHGLGARMYGKYRTEFIDVLGHWTNAVTEWNLLLDEGGGPYHNRTIGCNSPVFRNGDRVNKREIYCQTYLYTHFIEKGARVLYTSVAKRHIMALAVKNPSGEILLYVYNNSLSDDTAMIVVGNDRIETVALPAGCLNLWILSKEDT